MFFNRPGQQKTEILIAIVGAGAMGKGLLYQSAITPGVRCIGIADIKPERAIAAVETTGQRWRVVRNLAELHQATDDDVVGICEDGDLLARCERADVFVEASSSIIAAGQFSQTAVMHGKHLVLMNAEIDLIFGPYLLELCTTHGVTYSSCDGDQHGTIRHLIDDLQAWGFDLIMGGNIKGFLDRYSDPVKIVPEADLRNLDYRMATAYTDGTKLSIEMALLANAIGMKTMQPGMQGPRAGHVRDALDLFDLQHIRQGGVPVVDYVLGAEPDGGVFAIGYCDNHYQQSMLSYYKMGKGPFYLFYRPYHLCHVEAMHGITACLHGQSLLQPSCGFRTNVFAYAKRDLNAGERLDGIGGFTCYGQIENITPEIREGLPICLAEDVILKRPVRKNERIARADIAYDGSRLDFDMFMKAGSIGQ